MSKDDNKATMAVYFDLENIIIGTREADYPKFKMQKVLEHLLPRGRILVKRAYCDWDRYKTFKRPLHQASFELIEVPHVNQSGKNSADIRMVVDALDLCYTKPQIDTFVLLSGDSDFSPLVSKLRENNRYVIGIGLKESSSELFIHNCDEFIYYDDLVPNEPGESTASKAEATGEEAGTKRSDSSSGRAKKKTAKKATKKAASQSPAVKKAVAEPARTEPPRPDPTAALQRLKEVVESLSKDRGGKGAIDFGIIKKTLKLADPSFDERVFGYKLFGAMVQEAGKRGLIRVEKNDKGEGFVVKPVASAAS